MEHIRHIALRPRSDAAPPPAPSAAFSRALKNWLAVFSEHYRQEVSELSAMAYRQGLADLTAVQLDLACAEALRSCRFLPTVADIRAALAEARRRIRPLPPAAGTGGSPQSGTPAAEPEKCPQCQGLGGRIVPRTDGAGNWAVRCGCSDGIGEVEPQMNADEHG